MRVGVKCIVSIELDDQERDTMRKVLTQWEQEGSSDPNTHTSEFVTRLHQALYDPHNYVSFIQTDTQRK